MGARGGAARAARWAVVSLALTLAACRGEEVARVSLTGPGQTSTATWKTSGAAKGEVWIDFDGEWTETPRSHRHKGPIHENDPGLTYAVEVLEGATPVQKLTCESWTCQTRICGSTVRINNRHDSDCECKTDCVVELPRAGTFTVRATVTATGDFKGKNASLVIRQ
jgi:hypothetical protein